MTQDGSSLSPEHQLPPISTGESKPQFLRTEPNRQPVEAADLTARLEQIRQEIESLKSNPKDKSFVLPTIVRTRTGRILSTPVKTGIGKILTDGEEIISLPLRKTAEFILKRAYGDFVSPDKIKKSADKLTIVEAFDFLSRSYKFASGSKLKRIAKAVVDSFYQGGIRRRGSQTVEINGLMIEAPLALTIFASNPLTIGLLGACLVATLPTGLHETIHEMSTSRDNSRTGLHIRETVNGQEIWRNNNFNELATIDSMADHFQSAFKIPALLLGRLPSLLYPGPLAVIQWERMRRSLDKKFGKAHTRHLIDLALFYDDGLDMLQTTVDEVRGEGGFQKLSDRSTTTGLLKGLWNDVWQIIRK